MKINRLPCPSTASARKCDPNFLYTMLREIPLSHVLETKMRRATATGYPFGRARQKGHFDRAKPKRLTRQICSEWRQCRL